MPIIYWRFRASSRVETTGEKSAAWENAVKSAGVADPAAALQECWSCTGGSFGGLWLGPNGLRKSKCHRLVCGVRMPWAMRRVSRWIDTCSASKLTWQPASQNCPMDRSGSDASAGTMCPVRAARGKSGQSSVASWVDTMTEPFGLWIWIGLAVGRTLVTGACTGKKCDVHPVSAMAGAGSRLVWSGGSLSWHTRVGVVDDNDVSLRFMLLGDSRPCQMRRGVAPRGVPPRRLPRPVMMVVLPPWMFISW